MMSGFRQGGGALLLAAYLVLVLSSPAHAKDEITIDHVESAEGSVSMVLSVDGVTTGSVEPSSVVVEVDGREVVAEAKIVAAGDIDRTSVLVVDASKSMAKGGRLEAATAAIDAYLRAAPPDVAIGLILFAGTVVESIEPTTDHASVSAALEDVTLKGGTGVYDAMREGMHLVGDTGSRSLLVLSDGADTGSDTTLEVATNDALDAGVLVDVVTLSDGTAAKALSAIAEDTGGKVIPADPVALGTVLTAQADALAEQLIVSFASPSDVAGEATITVSADVGDATYVDSAFVTLVGESTDGPPAVERGAALVGKPMMLAGALAVFLGLTALLVTVLTGSGKSAAEKRLDAYFEPAGGQRGRRRSAKSGSADLKDSAVAVTSKVVNGDLETRISQRLAGAGSALTAAEWVLLHAGIAVGAAVVGFLLSGGGFMLLGLILGVVMPWVYLKWRHRRRLAAFNGQLAETLGLMAGGLQAGLSLPQAIDSVVREGNEPMAGELRRALVEQRLGIDITDGLDGIGERMKSEDFGWVVMAIRIQREVGGNLAEILHTVAGTLREREYLRRQVRALSAEGRLSGYILTALPPGLGVYMYFANREYVSLLWTSLFGWIMLGVATVLLILGSITMSKLAKVEV